MDYRKIVHTVYKVSDFISWQRNKSLILSPSFQRRPIWPKPAKSFLMDTIVRGFPIPIIFLREKTDLRTLEPLREVVDGQQRLRTIFSFIEPALLPNFEPIRDEFTVTKSHNQEIAGIPFQEIDSTIRQRILNYEFSVHVLPSDTEDREVLQIFSRMNSTGMKLNKQELRNAEFIGAFKRLAYSLAYEQLNRWRDWKVFSENDIARMLEVEETSDLIRSMLDGIHGLSQPALDKLYRKFEDEFPFEKEATRRFQTVMDEISSTLGELISSSPFSRRVLFHTLFTLAYDLLFGLSTSLEKRAQPNKIDRKFVVAFNIAVERIQSERLSDDLSRVLRGGTGNLESRKLRFEFIKGVYRGAKA